MITRGLFQLKRIRGKSTLPGDVPGESWSARPSPIWGGVRRPEWTSRYTRKTI
jgi:hypothetical protein